MKRYTALEQLPASELNQLLSEMALATATFTYDSAGRMATIVDTLSSPNITYTIAYDTAGNVGTITDGTRTWTLVYNGANQVTSITQSP